MAKRRDVEYTIGSKDESGKGTKSAKRNFEDLGETVGRFKKSLLGAAGAAGFGALIKSSIDAADRIGKLSTRLGASTEALSEYEHVAQQTGVTFQSLTTGWQRQTRRIAEAAQGTGAAKAALEELNLSAEKLNQLAPEEQFEVLAEALNGVASQQDRVRLAMKFWDSEGVSLLQTVDAGAEGLAAMRDEARELGLTLSEEAAQQAAQAADALGRIETTAKGVARELAISLTPGVELLGNAFAAIIPTLVQVVKGIGAVGAAAVSLLQGEFTEAGQIVRSWWGELGDTFSSMTTKLSKAWDNMQSSSERALSATQKNASAMRRLRAETEPVSDILRDYQISVEKSTDDTEKAAEATDTLSNAYTRLGRAARNATAGVQGTSVGINTRAAEDGERLSNQFSRVFRLSLPTGFQGPADNFATGTSAANQPSALAQGERVVSNRVTIQNLNIDGAGLPTDRGELRSWIRGVLVPEIERAGS